MRKSLLNATRNELSVEMGAVAARPVHHNCGIEHLSTANAFPGFKGTNEIIEFLTKHAAAAAWTFHLKSLPNVIAVISPMHIVITANVPKKP